MSDFRPWPKPTPKIKEPYKGLKRVKLKPYRRKPTGERAIMLKMYIDNPYSRISGHLLLPPYHEKFHWQGAHVLGKKAYPKFRLREDNIVMMTVEEHHYYDNKTDQVRNDPKWQWLFELRSELKQEYFKTTKAA